MLFSELLELAQKSFSALRTKPGRGVPLYLLPLHHVTEQIDEYLAAWTRVANESLNAASYTALHDTILQIDTLRLLDEQGRVERLVVLPTHPWLLAALASYQSTLNRNFFAQDEKRYPLTRDEVEGLMPRTVLEDWHLQHTGNRRLRMTDAAPFHFEFNAKEQGQQGDSLSYIARIVATKIERYLEMHPHLRDERRTLRLGFVNPGDGAPFLEGLHMWLRGLMPRTRLRILPLEQIPALDVLLFSTAGQHDDEAGSSFEEFFNAQVNTADEDVVRQTLLGRLRYRRCSGRGPAKTVDGVHVCFAHGLVDSHAQDPKTGLLADGWDGAFGDGLLATYLRRTLPGVSPGEFTSRRGLWLPPGAAGLRGALAALLALQRACKDSDPSPEKALFWDCRLPNLSSMAPTYEHSDWVVHLDRELSLELFESNRDDAPTIIEYSDQEVPQSPGFDTITATTRAEPYHDQLSEMLSLVGLDMTGREQEALDAAHDILDDINALSGSWALDFLVGSLANKNQRTRLMGNIGAALAYRWLRRVECGPHGKSVISTSAGDVVPVFISLEEIIRATPAARLRKSDGLIHRYRRPRKTDEPEKWCDDILVMYITRTETGQPSKLYGRIVEVKFGQSVLGSAEKAIDQVKGTNRLFSENLSGGGATVDAPFKNKLLSLLLKAQIEQAVAMGALSRDVHEHLNIPALSTNLATSNYTVDYMIGVDGQNLFGDALLLYTGDRNRVQALETHVQGGVRVITLGFEHVEWLAFKQDDSPTLVEKPQSTLPRLGRYTTVQTSPGPMRVTSEGEENAHTVEASQSELPWTQFAEDSLGVEPSAPALVEPSHIIDRSLPSEAEISCLKDAQDIPVKPAPYRDEDVVAVTKRLEAALHGHRIRVSGAPSARETDRGPRLLRAYVRLDAGESISSVRRASEDIARVVGTDASDIHITNIPERHSIALDLPVAGMSYAVNFEEVREHASFRAARAELELGFCAGIDVTGRALWTDLADMPHMLVAGTTGSGKTVFLRGVILTLLLSHSPEELEIRLSSSKPMDFKIFTKTPHSQGHEMAVDPGSALALAEQLVEEMERRIRIITDAFCDNLKEYNEENPSSALPYIVGVFDEYAAMILSFSDKTERSNFEGAIGHLAQKARAAGIHLIICMQRPDAAILKGVIKANILHRFALKLPQNQDSRVILDEGGAETLLGKGDLLYKDGGGRLNRLQVPFLDNGVLKKLLPR